MAKKVAAETKLETKAEATPVVNASGEKLVPVLPQIKDIRPTGNMVLIKAIRDAELESSPIFVQGQEKMSRQAYVLALGPQVNPDNGIKVGDRVLIQGSYVPGPEHFDEMYRLVLPDMIKAVLIDK